MVSRGGRRARAAAGADGGTGTCRGRSGQRHGARGDGCPARRPFGSAVAVPLGLTAGPEPQRSSGGGGRPHTPPPRARPIKSAPTPLRFRRWLLVHIPGGRRLCSLLRTQRRQRRRGEGGREEDWIRSSSRRRRKEKEGSLELEPPLPEPPFSSRGGSWSMPLSLSYCQYHRAAESMAHAQPTLLASRARLRHPLTGGFKREATPHWSESAFTPMPACSAESRSGIGGGGAEKQDGRKRGGLGLG